MDMNDKDFMMATDQQLGVQLPSSNSLDLPTDIQQMMGMSPNSTMMYQEGGMVQPAGVQMQAQGPRNSQSIDMEINQSMKQNPEVVARIRAAIEAGIRSGELNREDLMMAVELAKAVLENPSMYPQIRQFAIQKGLATEQELPAEYDEGLLIALIAVGKSMEASVQFPNQPVQQMKDGGQLKEVPEDNVGLSKLPENVSDIYNDKEYLKSQEYKKENFRFNLITSSFSFIILIVVLYNGYFEKIHLKSY